MVGQYPRHVVCPVVDREVAQLGGVVLGYFFCALLVEETERLIGCDGEVPCGPIVALICHVHVMNRRQRVYIRGEILLHTLCFRPSALSCGQDCQLRAPCHL